MYRYFIGAKNKIIIIYIIVNLYDCCIRYKLFTVRSSSMLVESNVNCLQYWQVICLLNQVWIAYSKFVKFYAYWIRYELFTVLSSCMLVKSAVNCLQHCQVLWLLNKMWIIYSIVKLYDCWIKCEYLPLLLLKVLYCCFHRSCFPYLLYIFWSLQIPPQCNSLQYFHHQLSTVKDKRKLLKNYYYCCIIRLNVL